MLRFRIIATVLLGISFVSMGVKNIGLFSESNWRVLIGWTTWGMIWRTFCIVAIWLI